MKKPIKTRTPILALILFVFAVGYTLAANKVVVIPLGADSVTQPFAVFAGGDQSTTVSTPQSVRMVSLTAPTDGVVIVNSTASVEDLTANSGMVCSINSYIYAIAFLSVDVAYYQSWISSGLGASYVGQLAGTRGFNVTAGQKYYYRLVCQHVGLTDSSAVDDPTLTAIFTPST